MDFVDILDNLRDQIELPNQSDESNNGCHINPSFISHPKLVKLKDIVLEHFRACEDTQAAGNTKGSRVMIFSQFRDSVQEISRMLSEYKPLVKVMSFIGQQSKGNTSKGLTQKEQLEVLVCWFDTVLAKGIASHRIFSINIFSRIFFQPEKTILLSLNQV